ncbi:MAG: hypothetical protein RSE23_01735 [Clostridia bacterium]
MRMATTNEAAEALKKYGVTPQAIRSGIKSGRYTCLRLGKRMMVDLDALEPLVASEHQQRGITIEELSVQTGLKVTAIRRGVSDGWIPARKLDGRWQFELAAAMEAIRKRIT